MDITLERKPLPPPEVAVEVSESLRRLGQEAQKRLSYSGLSQAIQSVSRDAEVKVALALQNLEIEPFTAESVAAYQVAKRMERSRLRKRVCAVLGSLGVMAIVCASIAGFVYHNDGIVAVFLCTSVASFFILLLSLNVGAWEWQRSWLAPGHYYHKPIPEYVLYKALQVRERLPQANFFVEELVRSEQRVEDPFMGFSYEDKDYYFEVWQESQFEAQVLRGS